jgi:uncharacterized protein
MKASSNRKRGAAKSAGRKKSAQPKSRAKPRARAAKSKLSGAGEGRSVRSAKAATRALSQAPAPASSEVELEAAVLRRLLRHFNERKDVQNIELMILAGFCRNCLSKWFVEAAQERGITFDLDAAREKIYGMPYGEWKDRHQQPATEDQLRRFGEAQRREQGTDAPETKGDRTS